MADSAKLIGVVHEIAVKEKLSNYEIKVTPVSSGGANYTSHLYAIVISSKDRNLYLFAKVTAISEKMKTDMQMLNVCDKEEKVCTELKAAFRQLEDRHGLEDKHRFRMPRTYGTNTTPPEEVIVFEDLSSEGFTTYDRMKSITWAYGSAVLTELAKFHSLSMAFEKELPDQYKMMLDSLGLGIMNVNPEALAVFWEGSKQKALEAVREENKERLSNFLKDKNATAFLDTFKAKKRQVLAHGDFRVSNIMHRDRKDGGVDVVPVDYQTIAVGCPVVDLYYFIFTGTDSQFRAQYYDKLVEHYYSELRAALTRLGVNPDEVYPREDFDFEIKDKLPFGLVVAIFCLPIVTVEAADAPTVDENMDFTSFNIQKTGDLYPDRINGVVDDFVRWGAI